MMMEDFIKQGSITFLDFFKEGGEFDQLIECYDKGGWWIAGSPEHSKFQDLAHKIKGTCRYIAFHRLEKKLETLQFSIRDGKELQVPYILNEVLEQCPYTQKAIFKYLEMPDNQVRIYKKITSFQDRYGDIHIIHKINYTFQKESIKMSALKNIQPYQPENKITEQPHCQLI